MVDEQIMRTLERIIDRLESLMEDPTVHPDSDAFRQIAAANTDASALLRHFAHEEALEFGAETMAVGTDEEGEMDELSGLGELYYDPDLDSI